MCKCVSQNVVESLRFSYGLQACNGSLQLSTPVLVYNMHGIERVSCCAYDHLIAFWESTSPKASPSRFSRGAHQ